MSASIWSILGAWSLGVVVAFIVCSVFAKIVHTGVAFVEDLNFEVQARLGAYLFTAFSVALTYLIFWGCYHLGDHLLRTIAG